LAPDPPVEKKMPIQILYEICQNNLSSHVSKISTYGNDLHVAYYSPCLDKCPIPYTLKDFGDVLLGRLKLMVEQHLKIDKYDQRNRF
jgi:hypothetical protein